MNPSHAAEGDVHRFVVASLRRSGERRRVVGIDRIPSDRSSSYRTEVVTARFADGDRLRLFLKDLSTRRYPDPDIVDRRRREIAIYRDVLIGSTLGVPAYYGAVEDPAVSRHWLLLEFVDGTPVKWLPFEAWVEAAAWLGRLHAAVATRPTLQARCRELPTMTAAFLVETATAATAAAGAFAPTLGRRIARALDGYPDVAAAVAEAPRTLVHGGYRPQNILLRRDAGPAGRICPTDWEEAAMGPPALDLAYLSDGFDERRRRALVLAYTTEVARHGAHADDGRFEALLDACSLHKNCGTLRKAVDRGFPPDRVHELVEMVESTALRVLGDGNATGRTGARSIGPAEAWPRGELRAALERLLSRRQGTPVLVRGLAVSPNPFAERVPAQIVRLDLEGGSSTTVLLKHPPRDDRHPDKRRRDREERVYEDLLDGTELPVVDYLGSIVDRDDRRWLVLEHVTGWDLRYHPVDVWLVAAAALGSLHRRFLDDPRLGTSEALLRLDAQHLRAWAQRAADAVGRRGPELGRRLERALRGFDDLVAPLASCAPTLVHNDLAPKNVLADRSTDPASIRIIDWELAGVGCGMLDVVHLSHGLGAEDARALHRAYVQAVSGTGLLPAGRDAISELQAACRIHRTVYRLAHVDVLGATDATVAGWVHEIVTLRAGL